MAIYEATARERREFASMSNGCVSVVLSTESPMAAKKDFLGFIDAGREVRRPPLVGMEFLHERAMSTSDLLRTRPRLKAKDLIGLLLRHFAGTPRTALPRRHTVLRVFTPAGIPAVKIGQK